MNLQEATKIIQDAVNTIQKEGFTLTITMQAQGNMAQATNKVIPMTAQEHQAFLKSIETKAPVIKTAKPAKKA